jgi:Kef-type K+ transport system membrane component KefB
VLMVLLDLDFTLPIKNPVIIFSLVLFIILFAPLLLNKIRIPHIIGLIVAGIIIGPYGFNILLRDSSIVLFGTVGLLYIMFTAGLELDIAEFRRNGVRSIVFGILTFIIPMTLGAVGAYYILGFNKLSSITIACLMASHTLLAYPIASRYGVARHRSVTMTIGGTLVTDTLALLVLAAIVGVTKGDIGHGLWIRISISAIIFALVVFFVFPLIAKWFFRKFDDSVSQYIFVLALVFLGAFLAEAAGLEAIIGAFLSGLSLNRFIPHSSPLMNRIGFVGNALFIPFFLIGVGMLVDVSVLFKGLEALRVAGVMIVIAVASKFLAAWFTQQSFNLRRDERKMIFGLSNARVGATLAVVLVAYNIIIGETETGEPLRLLNEDVLNGAIIMILVTCTISSFVVEKASRKLALQIEDREPLKDDETDERIMVSVAYPDTVNDLADLAFMLQSHKNKSPVYALHVVDEKEDAGNESLNGKKIMDQIVTRAAAADTDIIPITRYDLNISNGIIYTMREHRISDLVIGLHHQYKSDYMFFGAVVDRILHRTAETIFIYKGAQPLNTLRRMVVAVPPKAEYEAGFYHWFKRLIILSEESGLPVLIFANPDTANALQQAGSVNKKARTFIYQEFPDWPQILAAGQNINTDDLFVVITSRKGRVSYDPFLERIPAYLKRYFDKHNFIILYPQQLGDEVAGSLSKLDAALVPEDIEIFNKAGNYVKKIFTGPDEKDETK